MSTFQTMAKSESLDCAFRSAVHGTAEAETAQCLLLAQILNAPPEQCKVTRTMCELCIEQTRQRTFADHPIFPSLVYQHATEQLLTRTDTTTTAYWELWADRAEAALLRQTRPPEAPAHCPVCDVVLCAEGDSPQLRDVIDSVLNQSESVPILHLIDCGETPGDWGEIATRWNVQIHRLPGVTTPLSAATQIALSMKTAYFAVQSPAIPCEPRRLAVAVRAIREAGAEMFVAHVPAELSPSSSVVPSNDRVRPLIPWSLVVRRATLVDMGVTTSEPLETETDLIREAYRQGRMVVTCPPSDFGGEDALDQNSANPIGSQSWIRGLVRTPAPSPLQVDRPRRPRFTSVPVRCDVVLPFRGQLHYVREALDSLLKQEQATPIIHLIDDATPEDTTDFLNEWVQHPQVRVYRNRENVGQFQSFNNVAAYWETDLVAVQDADDISLPHRLSWAGQMLHWSGSDYFGGAVELFGDDELIRPVMSETSELVRMRRADYRRSFYPLWSKTDYFLENPTAVFRVAMFREMGGYADFGSRLMNRTSLDTEFQLRCLFRGVRFAITREVVVRYRVHPESATQDRQTGWGTTARASSIRQLEDRCHLFRGGDFDPRSFGALGRYTGVTERWLERR